jgi:hypothetical protein
LHLWHTVCVGVRESAFDSRGELHSNGLMQRCADRRSDSSLPPRLTKAHQSTQRLRMLGDLAKCPRMPHDMVTHRGSPRLRMLGDLAKCPLIPHDVVTTEQNNTVTFSPQANIPAERSPRSAKPVPYFEVRGCFVTSPHGRKSRFSKPEPLLLLSSSSSFILSILSGPRSRPTTFQKI